MGDPSGVGPELCIKAAKHLRANTAVSLRLFGDLAHLQKVNSLLGEPLEDAALSQITEDTGSLGPYPIGEVSAASGQAAYQAVVAAAQACLCHEVTGMVTAPLNKEAQADRGGVGAKVFGCLDAEFGPNARGVTHG